MNEVRREIKVEAIKKRFDAVRSTFKKINNYYIGETDALINYKKNAGRSNLKVNCNYLKKFVKEETSYSVGNQIAYSSKMNNPKIQEKLDLVMEGFKENHDVNVFKDMVLFGKCYEAYYYNSNKEFRAKAISPVNGFHSEDNEGNITGFINCYTDYNDEGEVEEFVDFYTANDIQVYDKDLKLIETYPHYMGEIPVGFALLSDFIEKDTIFSDIKGLQDALETNLSDITNEVSDFRNAYLVMRGVDMGEDEIERAEMAESMKELGIFEVDTDANIEWLIKNINDTFVQNTLKTLQEKMYELTSHINHNDSESTSNASGVALKSRLISLMQRCSINQNSFKELLKKRIRIIFEVENKIGGQLDWKDVKITFTPNIPSDDLQIAQMLQQLDGIVSKSTGRTLLSFIENSDEEEEKIKKENENMYGNDEFKNEEIDENNE